ncbi:MAG: SAM-dependent methyltransferase [Lachnospiraceae bacterium]|nr:SAM-dependent methyltransferase [Lachnospiraceae bacterium]
MEKFLALIEESLNIDLVSIIISNPRQAGEITKIKIRPVLIKDCLYFQAESFSKKQAFHKNLTKEALMENFEEYIHEFKQIEAVTKTKTIHGLISKKGKITVKVKSVGGTQKALSHNRKKRYIIEEGTKAEFLIDLGVMTKEGKIVRTKYDKFRQINRFLEFIEDILPNLPKGRELTIIDFGCGKSYLTFAMYYYLKEMKGYDIRIIGLDLKADVITHCNQLRTKYGFEKLDFYVGNIENFEGVNAVDMVVTLHACDTATDFALHKAVKWNASVILSVPCCQHELNRQMKNQDLAPIMDYGLLKERMAALATDGLRGKLLEMEGYKTQILEFIDMEHTPKNILIRAVKGAERARKQTEEYQRCCSLLGVRPTLEKLLWEGEKEREE